MNVISKHFMTASRSLEEVSSKRFAYANARRCVERPLNKVKTCGVTVEASRFSHEKSGDGELNTSIIGSSSPLKRRT